MSSFSLSSLPLTIVAFVVAIVILVGAHEWGHFWMARRLGIKVLRFSIGIGKPLWKRISPKDGVEYVISAIPLGGYVKLLGEHNDDGETPVAPEDLPFSFQRAPVWKRVLVLLAGPVVNLVLAALIYWGVLMVGIPGFKPVIGDVTAGSLAAQAGLHSGDLITRVQGHDVLTREDTVVYLFDQMVEGAVQLTVRGDEGAGAPRTLMIHPAHQPDLSEPENLMTGLGFEFWRPKNPAVIGAVLPGSPAQQAGLQAGDLMVAVDGQAVDDLSDVIKIISAKSGQTVHIKIDRAGATMDLPVRVNAEISDGEKVGRIGVQGKPVAIPQSMQVLQRYGPLQSAGHAVAKTWQASVLDLKVIGQMLTGKLSVKNLSGPVGIAEVTGYAAREGLLTFIGLLAFISVNLGILNLLPIPMLDGGQVVYQLIEWVKGSPVSERVQLITQQIGIAALIMLVSLTLYNDIARHLS
ncbi:MAG TPA: RIP metalloprotease RseP [Steroidobacteraceae bacterium]|nr:RIP metalloprotease RseP [Steroidobacteraceae bacterium]